MSVWTNFLDNAAAFLKDGVGEVTDDMKQDANAWLVETGLPLAETSAANIVEQLQDQAKTEDDRWCKIRDYLVYPALIRFALWGVKKVLTKTASSAAA